MCAADVRGITAARAVEERGMGWISLVLAGWEMKITSLVVYMHGAFILLSYHL